MSNYLTTEQEAQLLQGVDPGRVSEHRGHSHMEAYDIRRWLIRIFGFARFSVDTLTMELAFEAPNNDGSRVSVGYRAQVKLTVHSTDGTELATYTEWAAGDSINQSVNMRGTAHDQAIKTAESQGLKRCAVNLGDQFGLSLYENGAIYPIVGRTLNDADGLGDVAAADSPVATEQEVAGEESQEVPVVPPVDAAKLELYDEVERLKVAIASEPPDVRNRLRILWGVNGLAKIGELDLEGVAEVLVLIEEAKRTDDRHTPPESYTDSGPAVLSEGGDPAARRAFYGTQDEARTERDNGSEYYGP